jgi:hypothetical protein
MVRAIRFFLATVLIGMLILAINIVPVSAGGGSPTLSADHNPVIVPDGQTSGQVTLTWDAGKGSTVEFYDSINGGPEFGPYVQPVAGSHTDTLVVGQAVTYRVYTAGKAQLLDTLTVTVIHPLDKPPAQVGDCNQGFCISDVSVKQGFDQDGLAYLDFSWTTSDPAGAIVAVSKKPAISNVDGNEFAHVDGAALQIERTGPKHSAHIGNLAFSKYYFVIEAIDANGNKVKHYGEYTFYGKI